jgi:uncharacterized MAPEG superfamily protein
MTAFWATCFFWLRLVHAVVYLFALPYVRTLVFTLGSSRSPDSSGR